MNRVNRAVAALLRRSMQVMPAERREWAEAVWSEAAEVPSGWRQLRWLAGGLRMTVREAALARRMRYPLAFAAVAAGTVWSAWSGPPGNAAATINRVDVIAMVVILATLPWIVGRTRGAVSRGRLARLVRTGGYVAIFALVLVRAAVRRVADAPPNNLGGATSAWVGEVAYLAVMAGYVALILAVTARRSPADRVTVATSVATGMALGVMAYALGPLGFPLRFAGAGPASLYDAAMVLGFYLAVSAPLAAGLAAGRRDSRSEPTGSGVRSGLMAGLIIGAAAALVVAVLSTATIALLPYDAWLRQWASSHIGHWTPMAGQWAPVLGPGTRQGYVAGNSAFAAGYLIVLLLAPLLGCALGAWGARSWRLLTR
jgi:hypothetical protein